jgi:hypothetical protein
MAENWGPWASGIEPAERMLRLRTLGVVAQLLFGPRHPLVTLAAKAERLDADALADAELEINRLPARDLRKLVSTYSRTAARIEAVRRAA